jgi:hypothetical protein
MLPAEFHVWLVTANGALAETVPTVAVTLVEPTATPDTVPPVTVAIADDAVDQVALAVRLAVLPSE